MTDHTEASRRGRPPNAPAGNTALAEPPWRPMSDAPKDGRIIELARNETDAEGVAGSFRATRQHDGRRWTVGESWMDEFRRTLTFTPAGWRFHHVID